MPKRKPRKRDYIPPEHEIVNKKEKVPTKQRPSANKRGSRDAQGRYVPPAPSIMRTVRRLPVYFLALTALQYFLPPQSAVQGLSQNEQIARAVMMGALFTLMFAPFIHWMERFSYNRYMKRNGLLPERAPKRRAPDTVEEVEGTVVDSDTGVDE